MIPPKKPEWEITMRHAGSVVMAIPFVVAFALVLWKFSPWRVISPTLGIVVFAFSAIRLRPCLLLDSGMVFEQTGRTKKENPYHEQGAASEKETVLRQSAQRIVRDKSGLHVRREKALDFSGCNSRPGTGSLHPVATETTAEVTKRSELSV